jgi:hypothetical protein
MTVKKLLIHTAIILAAVLISLVAGWLGLGPVAHSAA